MRRSGFSVPLNIVEGHVSTSKREFFEHCQPLLG
ncbi:MAG: four helix bundle protein [Candidatus Omnitrophica bacterium]|nr:four helix bundle protein [Candidatus Omnitrophota bacterium]